ncbi:hypothetical protein OH768_25585 [Streptomyces sp. NBC_01622]|nr:hypothetical protein OH768_25585 [Streptomyces sp. NBC_01622]
MDLAPVRDPSLAANTMSTAPGMPDLGTRPVVVADPSALSRRN